MVRLRILGPRERLADVLRALQDLGVLHLAAPAAAPAAVAAATLDPRQRREERHLRRGLEYVERALRALGLDGGPLPRPAATATDRARWVRGGWQAHRACERLAARQTALEEERALILKYQHFFHVFGQLLESRGRLRNAAAYQVLLRGRESAAVAELRAGLKQLIGDEFELYTQPLPSGELALLVLVSAGAAGRVEQLLARARVQEIPVPAAYGGASLAEAIPRMMARLGELPRALDDVRQARERLAAERGTALRRARAGLHDRLRELEALPLSGVTDRAFVIDGFAPAAARADVARRLARDFGATVVVSEVAREEWVSEEAPVVLRNPRLLRPFELLIGLLPLPRYGTIDPTPFVAVFFPAFFGLMVGDIGYGVVLAAIALAVRARARPGTPLRSAAEVAGACAVFTIVAGMLFGELFGDLGARLMGLRPLLFDRGEALIPFLLLAVALGAVHVLLGLILGVAANLRRRPRHALGSGLAAVMLVLTALVLLAAVRVLPGAFFTPAVIALLVAFPVLIAVEGAVAPIELLSTIGNILSYARIMALGVASVMLAVIANRMHGAIGSVAVGVLFAVLFHLVNFGIALFSPTIHALRLHYVEFFGKFYSPGGVSYRPFGHWAGGSVAARH